MASVQPYKFNKTVLHPVPSRWLQADGPGRGGALAAAAEALAASTFVRTDDPPGRVSGAADNITFSRVGDTVKLEYRATLGQCHEKAGFLTKAASKAAILALGALGMPRALHETMSWTLSGDPSRLVVDHTIKLGEKEGEKCPHFSGTHTLTWVGDQIRVETALHVVGDSVDPASAKKLFTQLENLELGKSAATMKGLLGKRRADIMSGFLTGGAAAVAADLAGRLSQGPLGADMSALNPIVDEWIRQNHPSRAAGAAAAK